MGNVCLSACRINYVRRIRVDIAAEHVSFLFHRRGHVVAQIGAPGRARETILFSFPQSCPFRVLVFLKILVYV